VHSLFCRQRKKPPTASRGGIPLRNPRKSSADCHQFKITCKPFIINILHLLPTKLLPSHRVRHPPSNPANRSQMLANPIAQAINPCIFRDMPFPLVRTILVWVDGPKSTPWKTSRRYGGTACSCFRWVMEGVFFIGELSGEGLRVGLAWEGMVTAQDLPRQVHRSDRKSPWS
jgi:hypothetical protein